jgi:hypothetical protein
MEIAFVMDDVGTSETSASFYETTLRNIPEDTFILAAMKN